MSACMCFLERGGERQRSVYLLKACLTGSLKRIPQLQRYSCSSLIRADLIAETDMKNFPDHPVCVRQDSFSVLYVGQCLVQEELLQDHMNQVAHSLVPDLYRLFSVTMSIGRQDSSNRPGIRLSDPYVWC